MFQYDQGVFKINAEETFVWGGEFHYFRVPKNLWLDRLQKIKDAGFNLVSTYIPWIWHEYQKGDIDLHGRTCAERDLKSFLDTVKEVGLWLLVRPGPYVMSELVNSGIPEWLIKEHPEIRAVKEDGQFHPSMGLVSYLHPVYLDFVKGWYKKVFTILKDYESELGGPIVMIQYDNEVGMYHWVTGQGDYSDNTLSHFKAFIVNKYGKELFDHELSTFKDFDHYISLYRQGKTNKEVSFVINQEYKLFFRVFIKDYLEKLIEIATKYGAKSMPVVNIHGFSSVDYGKRGNLYPIGISQLYETAKIKDVILAGDYYVGNIVSENFFDVVLANAFTKAVQPVNQPLFSAEFQGGFQNGVPRLQPTTHDLKTRLTISNGMNAINYYMFVGGENFEEIGLISRRHDWQSAIGTDGSLRRHYHIIKHIVDLTNAYGKAFVRAKLSTQTTLSFDPDYYMTEFKNDFTRSQANALQNARQNYLYNGIGKSLVMNNISFDAIDMNHVSHIDPIKNPTLICFSTEWMKKEAQEKLVNYVSEGGKLFLFPEVPTKDLLDRPCHILKDFIDVDIKEKVHGKRVNINGHDSVNCHYAQVYDQKIGFATLDLDSSKVTGFKKEIKKGLVYVFGMAIKSDWDYIDQIVGEIFNDMNIMRSGASNEWLHVAVRSDFDGDFVFINNFEEFEKKSVIELFGKQGFGGFEFTIPMRSGLILPLNWKVSKDLTIQYSTAEIIHLEVNNDEINLTAKPLRIGDIISYVGKYKPVKSNLYEFIGENQIQLNSLLETQIQFKEEENGN
ncbi:MAG: beta-galactosidase [Firmicutes bacterium]|nr:beta-galactosidase [Bacillota bacterium]